MTSLQTFLTIGALVLVSILGMNFFRTSSNQNDMKFNNEAIITATAFAHSIFETINAKSFDEVTTTSLVSKEANLTLKSSFGRDEGETTLDQFDDVDDFDNYVFTDTLGGLGVFSGKIAVNYADRSNINQNISIRTFTKKIEIGVTNKYLLDTLKFMYAYSF